MQHFGTVALVGVPNAGKSTLLNTLLGSKISIVCHKRQTTRTRIAGVFTQDHTQIVLIDTPGIFFNPKNRLEKYMVAQAWQGLFEADEALFLVDAARTRHREDVEKVIEKLKKEQKKVILVLNKVDQVKNKEDLLHQSKSLMDEGVFKEAFMICAKTGNGVPALVHYLMDRMPAAEWRYPEDQLATLSEKMLAEELTREVLMTELHDEIPYGLTVQTDLWEPFENGSLKIVQTIFIEKPSHKPIVLGKNGQKIKIIGSKAREEISRALGKTVHLFLHVKIDEGWQEKSEFYPRSDI